MGSLGGVCHCVLVLTSAWVRRQLGMWVDKPTYKTAGDLWYKRWAQDQPHQSFDVDGDGTVSAMDMYVSTATSCADLGTAGGRRTGFTCC